MKFRDVLFEYNVLIAWKQANWFASMKSYWKYSIFNNTLQSIPRQKPNFTPQRKLVLKIL